MQAACMYMLCIRAAYCGLDMDCTWFSAHGGLKIWSFKSCFQGCLALIDKAWLAGEQS